MAEQWMVLSSWILLVAAIVYCCWFYMDDTVVMQLQVFVVEFLIVCFLRSNLSAPNRSQVSIQF